MVSTPNNDLSRQQQYRASLLIQDLAIYILNPLAAGKLQEAMMLLKSAKANANTKEGRKKENRCRELLCSSVSRTVYNHESSFRPTSVKSVS